MTVVVTIILKLGELFGLLSTEGKQNVVYIAVGAVSSVNLIGVVLCRRAVEYERSIGDIIHSRFERGSFVIGSNLLFVNLFVSTLNVGVYTAFNSGDYPLPVLFKHIAELGDNLLLELGDVHILNVL